MPGMTGMELIEQSKAMLPQLKTILFSGYVDEKFLASTDARPDMFMRKPFYPQTLVDLVTDVLKDRPRA
jgi:YesN/AraC family two-component response regulator